MSLEKLIGNALIITGDRISDLAFYRDPGQTNADDQVDPEFEDTINLDPVPCSLDELLDKTEPPSFVAYSERYIYYFMRSDVDVDGKAGILRILPRREGEVVELDYRSE